MGRILGDEASSAKWNSTDRSQGSERAIEHSIPALNWDGGFVRIETWSIAKPEDT